MTTRHSFSAESFSVEKAKAKVDRENPAHRWIAEIQHTIFQLYADHTLAPQYKMGWLIQLYMTIMDDNKNNEYLYDTNGIYTSHKVDAHKVHHYEYDDYNQEQKETEGQQQQAKQYEYWLSQLLIEMLQIYIHERHHHQDCTDATQKGECDAFTAHLHQFKFNLSPSANRLLDTGLQRAACLYTAKKKLHKHYLYPSLRQKRWQQLLDREREQLQSSHRVQLVRLWLDYMEQHPELLDECMQINGQPESISVLGTGRVH
ncbi:hypothetical protein ACE3MZ_11400 [Paenibacillus sp. WLX1005]|uniref:hypothetical protein n=1 Tax=Paenibacillus sp. WLX1005 TaxID=3243766 RepID=UPI0039845B61